MIGFYSGFHCSLRDKILANGDHFGLSSKDEEE
jgi:hypothetical protein